LNNSRASRRRRSLCLLAALLLRLGLPLGHLGHDRLEERVDARGRHQGVGDRGVGGRQIIDDDSFKFRDDLAVDRARVFERAAAERDLEEQLEGDERDRQGDDARAVAAQVLADEVEVAAQAAVGVTEAPVDTTILKRPEDARGQPPLREERERRAVVAARGQHPPARRGQPRLLFRRERALGLSRVVDVAVEREGVERVRVLGRVKLGQRDVRRAQRVRLALVRAELDLPRGVRGQDFIEAEVQPALAELRDDRGQVYRAAVADALLFGDGRERRDLDGAARQPLDVEPQGLRHLFQPEPVAPAALQALVALARLQSEVAAPRARAQILRQQALARPLRELFERRRPQRPRRRAEARDGRLRVHARHLVRRLDDGQHDLRQ
jgi:hypothetical protein